MDRRERSRDRRQVRVDEPPERRDVRRRELPESAGVEQRHELVRPYVRNAADADAVTGADADTDADFHVDAETDAHAQRKPDAQADVNAGRMLRTIAGQPWLRVGSDGLELDVGRY